MFRRFIIIIALWSVCGTPSSLLGAAAVLLNNYSANCPIIDVDHFAFDPGLPGQEKPYLRVLGGAVGGMLSPILVVTNNSSVIPFKEPGYFDAGVGTIAGLNDGNQAEFEIQIVNSVAWPGRTLQIGKWTQPTGSWPGNSEALPALQIPIPILWAACADCQIVPTVVTLCRGKGRIEMIPPWPYGEPFSPFTQPWPPPGPATVHAVPDPGFRFARWVGGNPNPNICCGLSVFWQEDTQDWLDFVLQGVPVILIATFEPSWNLRINCPFGGWVTNNPPGSEFAPGTEVKLSATAKPNFEFTHWTGDATGTNRSILVAMTTNLVVSANFRATLTPQLIVQASGSGDGIASNGFNFTLLGKLGHHYSLESSADLTNWALSSDMTATNSVNAVQDASFPAASQRFYRVRDNTGE